MLYLAGINHLNPVCRDALHRYLTHLVARHPTSPSFIAVEWSEPWFRQVAGQRAAFKELARAEWPGMTEADLNSLALSLGYEADTHRDLLPDVKVLWLDAGRENEPGAQSLIDAQAERRILLFRGWQRRGLLSGQPGAVLEDICRAAAHLTERDLSDPQFKISYPQRDRRWSHMVQDALYDRSASAGPQPRWGVAVVGVYHLLDRPGFFRNHLHRLCVPYVPEVLQPGISSEYFGRPPLE